MRASIEITGLNQYLLSLARAEKDIDAFATEAVDEAATIVEQELLARVPVGETGKLKQQIYRTRLFRDGNKVYAYAGLDLGEKKENYKEYIYGLVLEFGSKHVAARPWFRPGMNAAKRKIAARWKAMYEARYGR
jgi:hypothetical protein